MPDPMEGIKRRPARSWNKLVTHMFNGAMGFRDAEDTEVGDKATAVCVRPGTSLLISQPLLSGGNIVSTARMAIFVEIGEKNDFPGGALKVDNATIALALLDPGQAVEILAIPAAVELDGEPQP